MRTDEEILARIKELEARDALGFESIDLKGCLSFEKVKPFLKDGVTDWTATPKDRKSILKEMEDYMSFAWEKANGCRGISAWRTLAHYKSWVWLLDDQEAEDAFGDLDNYEHYGKAQLIRICEHFGWDHSKWDDDVRVNEG